MSRRAAPARLRHPAARSRPARQSRVGAFLKTAAANGRLPAFLLSVGLAVFVVGFLFSSDFLVRSVVVEGNKVAFADSIVAASGALGEPIFRLDTAQIARRVAAHPAVAEADVSARFPDTIVVRLTERIPVVVWQVDQHAVLVDERGWVIADGSDPVLPRIYQPSGDVPVPGTRLPATTIQAAAAVTQKLGALLGTLQFDPATGLTAQLTDGRSIILGSGDQMPLKLSVVDGVMKLGERWSRLDVREPSRPYYQ